MNLAYFKRFKMEIGLHDLPPAPSLPVGYFWVAWDDSLLELHAEVQYHCFCDEIDSTLFPCLGDRFGCQMLLNEIRRKPGFLPEATWLIGGPTGYCGTIQGIADRYRFGAIQNLGVTPAQRLRGLGTSLLLQALHGFRRCGLTRAYLEVTADNDGAVRLYQRLGFRKMKTVYKAVNEKQFG
jgi:ribosomal protein S18 acetylase RimI-like enzyme